jgi:type II secretory ATPase GspE/PulE/Tfp pilus assembly ATPase PilB-like protein
MSETQHYLDSLPNPEAVETARLVDMLLVDSAKMGASDIHIEPWNNQILVRLRLNGLLQELVSFPMEYMEKLSGRLKVMANLVSYESDRPQEGHSQVGPELGGVELRMSFFPVLCGGEYGAEVKGEKIVIRIFDPNRRSFQLEDLGFESDTLESLKSLLTKPSGMILLTGPTGCGKTTAIYAALTHLGHVYGSKYSISAVEDPVEYKLPMVSQAQINTAKEFTYPIALRSLMRQDPQVIMVGEIRDPETASIAVQAGLTGHLVISTIHSGSTAGVFARMINMNIEPFLLASSVIGIMGLRLVRKNCVYCAQPYEPEASLLSLTSQEFRDEAAFRVGDGCEHCAMTGFEGQVSVTEMMQTSEALREAIVQKMPSRKLQEIAVSQGMRSLWDSGLRRVLHGETPFEEMIRSVPYDPL